MHTFTGVIGAGLIGQHRNITALYSQWPEPNEIDKLGHMKKKKKNLTK